MPRGKLDGALELLLEPPELLLLLEPHALMTNATSAAVQTANAGRENFLMLRTLLRINSFLAGARFGVRGEPDGRPPCAFLQATPLFCAAYIRTMAVSSMVNGPPMLAVVFPFRGLVCDPSRPRSSMDRARAS